MRRINFYYDPFWFKMRIEDADTGEEIVDCKTVNVCFKVDSRPGRFSGSIDTASGGPEQVEINYFKEVWR